MTPGRTRADHEQVLVAIMNNLADFARARDEHWYRIPVESAHKWVRGRWPPQWLAFYQTEIFGTEKHSVNYYAKVHGIREVGRSQLFPEERQSEKANRRYYRLALSPLQHLPEPILSRRWRFISFIPTTWSKFVSAVEINDLYDESPLEDRLWAEFKRLQISAERQEFIEIRGRNYALDFAVYCVSGKLDVETDGDTWHADPARIPQDNLRDNDLETSGWSLLRFNTRQIREQMAEYCLPTIVENINNLGGVSEGRLIPRVVSLDEASPRQLSLFDDQRSE
jgi:very-short-patch-repair endonuclease